MNLGWNTIPHMRLLNIHCFSGLVFVMLWVSRVFHSQGNLNSMTYLQHCFNSTWSEIKSKIFVLETVLFWHTHHCTVDRYTTPTHAQITSEISCSHWMLTIPFYKLYNNIKHQLVSILIVILQYMSHLLFIRC